MLLSLCFVFSGVAQEKKKLFIERSHSASRNPDIPGALILSGAVKVRHQGITVFCDKAYYYEKRKFIKALGNVVLNQGDTIIQRSKFAEYDGNTQKAVSWGDVRLTDPQMILTTDTLYFDRKQQTLYYESGGEIRDTTNVLVSTKGNYFLNEKKFRALSHVTITNPDYILKSNHLDYYTDSGQAFMYGPSTVTGKDNVIYCEKGFYDTKTDISHFVNHAIIKYKSREIEGDSLFYDRKTGFASATQNIQITDTINKTVIRGNYAEYYRNTDSVFVVKKAVAVSLVDKDSMYVHGDTIMATGKPKKRIVRIFHHAKFFKPDLSGKCDSIHVNQETGLTQLIGNPILWSGENQMTGDTIQILHDVATEKLDSLKVINDVFIVQKDSAGFNQIKGKILNGKFIDNEMRNIDIKGNSEVIYYVRDSKNKLIGINKTLCSYMNFKLKKNKIQVITFFVKPDGNVYPLSQLPENARKLKGFLWKEKEKVRSVEDLFR